MNLYTFEIDENVKRDKTAGFVTWLNIVWTMGWDMNEKLDNTTKFVTLLNMWKYWKRYECEII